MTVTLVALLLCSLVALSSACCTPDQWEGREGSITGYADHKRRGINKQFMSVSYDAVNNRTAAFVDYKGEDDDDDGEHHSHKFKVITRYDNDEGKLYVLNVEKDKCWVKDLKRPFRKACIPAEAKSIGDYYMGLKDGFKVTGYEFKGKRISAFVAVEKMDNNQCIPVGETIHGSLRKVGFVENVGIINVTMGIKDTQVFDIPKACEKSEDTELPEGLTRDYYIMSL